MSDRTVHAVANDGREVVRYNRAGKWYVEGVVRRHSIVLWEAVLLAAHPDATWYEGRVGGSRFDAEVRKVRAAPPVPGSSDRTEGE